jgi:deoxyribodipyrimidine photo-lyase
MVVSMSRRRGPLQVVWHRADLRLHDNSAVTMALAAGPAVGIVILDPNNLAKTSARRRAWFIANVRALRASYASRGGRLHVRSGAPWEELPRFCADVGAERVHAVRNYTPYAHLRDERTRKALSVPLLGHDGQYVHETGTLRRDDGGGYRVYTPYAKRWWKAGLPDVDASVRRFPAINVRAPLGELPDVSSDVPLPPAGEAAARKRLEVFCRKELRLYHVARDRLDGKGSSGLSSYLNIGVLSPRLAAKRVLRAGGEGGMKWVAELAWRDFLGDLLWQHPTMTKHPLDPRWERFPWSTDRAVFQAWRDGRTGVPSVDAAMRQLRETGTMSNRARMVVAQCACKLLLLDWTRCERVFRDWLLDGDTAQNVGSWQWAAGLGVDAAPYFRIFNPVSQGQQHDPDGAWVAEWMPESGGEHALLPGAIVDPGAARKRYLELVAATVKGLESPTRQH